MELATHESGAGPPLVLLHGASSDATAFRLVAPILAARFRVIAVDRRGRGGSGDEEGAYSIESEFDDVASLVDGIGGPVDLFGHSYGAAVALGAAPRARNLRRLVLYEPSPGIQAASPELLARMEALLAEGDREAVIEIVLREFAGFDDEGVAAFRASELWAPRVAAAHTVPREVRAEEGWSPDPAAFAGFDRPTLFLLGSESPGWAVEGTEELRRMLPVSRVARLEGQGHAALVTAPELVADEVLRFLTE